MAVSFLCLFPTVPLIGLQSVIVAFPGHTHLHFGKMDAHDAFIRSNMLYTKAFTYLPDAYPRAD